MERLFKTHYIRNQEELTGKYWDFVPCEGEKTGEAQQFMTPCCWETHPGFENYRGKAEFSTSFYAKGNIRLQFKGVSHTATVFLDGAEIARHYNAYTPFEVCANDLADGAHSLKVLVDNGFGEDSALHVPNDYQTYGGIIRPVYLENINSSYIRYCHVTTVRKGEGWTVKLSVCLKNVTGGKDACVLKIKAAGSEIKPVEVCLDAFEERVVYAETECTGVSLWSEECPALYFAECELEKNGTAFDDLRERFGFREVSIKGRDILMNGKKLFIKGFCRHEDHPMFGCALPLEAMAGDIELLKELGANSVRTSHYPNDERFLDLCDERGILVWEENHARGLSEEQMKNPNFELQAEDCIREMITAHFNHPSIYIWGILNECASDSEYGRECYKKQYDLIAEIDPTRPRSSASCKFKTDICLDLPEVVSYNIYPQWYHDTPVREYLDDLHEWVEKDTQGAGKPFLITETGAGAIYGNRDVRHAKWSEEYQAEALEKQLTAVLSSPYCSGVYIWQFCDVRISDEWWYSRPRTMNNKGVVDEYRRPKLSFETVKRIFKEYSRNTDRA
ncbi:MAG: hypothetical protein IKS11_10910 [Lachnospiraceae bacterium]|nr:hypothetical protein [Lachnospiraceae bacterium]